MKKIVIGVILLSNMIFAKEFLGKVVGVTDTGRLNSTRIIYVDKKGAFKNVSIFECIVKEDVALVDITKIYISINQKIIGTSMKYTVN